MVLMYKEDWEEAKNSLAAWWEGEERSPLLQVVGPREGVQLWRFYDGWDFCRYPDKPEIAIRNFEDFCRATFFGGVAFPNLWINFGAGVLAAFLGAEPIFRSNTMWFGNQRGEGRMSLRDLSESELDRGNVWWKRVMNATRKAVAAHRGRFVVGITDIGGVLDVVAALHGTIRLIVSLYRRSSEVKAAISNILDLWHECYDEFHRVMVEGGHEGVSAWMGIWCPHRWYPIQCDISYMIPPSKFEEFVKPHLEEQCSRLNHTVYHLDGPGQIPHLRSLLSIEELDAIQWVPGAKEEGVGHDCGSPRWFKLYEQILEAGKGLVVAMPYYRVENFLKVFPRGRIIVQTLAFTERDARNLLKKQGRG